MNDTPLKVWMLGEFSISMGEARIDDSGNRSRKVWLLLAYMIYNRNRPVSQEELISLLWGEDTGSTNPVNALKTMLHRVRTMLNQLDPTAGHSLIVRRGGSYAWNTDFDVDLDVERFDETGIVMTTSAGTLVVTGEGLHIGKLSLEGGELHVEGRIDAISYEDAPQSQGGFFRRLLG